MRHLLILMIAMILPAWASAADLTKEALEGTWMYTRIVAEDYTVDVNRLIEFKPDSTVVTYVIPDKILSSAAYEVVGNKVIYRDEKGAQHWIVLTYDGTSFSVDHQGAKMFFERRAD